MHAKKPGSRLTLCGVMNVYATDRIDDFDSQIRVSCPRCRLELDKIWAAKHAAEKRVAS